MARILDILAQCNIFIKWYCKLWSVLIKKWRCVKFTDDNGSNEFTWHACVMRPNSQYIWLNCYRKVKQTKMIKWLTYSEIVAQALGAALSFSSPAGLPTRIAKLRASLVICAHRLQNWERSLVIPAHRLQNWERSLVIRAHRLFVHHNHLLSLPIRHSLRQHY